MDFDWQKPRSRRGLLWGFFALILLPFLLLSAFAYPTTDDYCFAWSWQHRGFWLHQSWHYRYWSGRYIANMLMVANPLAFGWWGGHRVAPPLLFLGYAAAARLFFRELTGRQFSDLTYWALSGLFLFVFLAQHPYIAGYFYWYTDAPYALADIGSLLFLVAFVRYETRQGTARWLNFAAICLLTLFIMGCNELPLLFVLLLLGALNFFSYIHTRRFRWDYGVFLAVGLAGACLALMAPGNQVRANSNVYDAYPRADLSYTLTHAPKAAFDTLLGLFPLVLVASLLLYPLAVRLTRRATQAPALTYFLGVPPVYAVLTYLGALLAAFFPTFWAIGQPPAPMPLSVIYFWLVTGWFWLLFVLVFAWERRARRHPDRVAALPTDLPPLVTAVIGLYLLVSFASSFNFRSAYSDLLTGRAYRFDQQMKNRLALLRRSAGPVVTVPALHDVPVTIVPPTNSCDWVFGHPAENNTCASEYFGKKAINFSP